MYLDIYIYRHIQYCIYQELTVPLLQAERMLLFSLHLIEKSGLKHKERRLEMLGMLFFLSLERQMEVGLLNSKKT